MIKLAKKYPRSFIFKVRKEWLLNSYIEMIYQFWGYAILTQNIQLHHINLFVC